MSELIDAQLAQKEFRWKLLTTVSLLTLVGSTCIAQNVDAEDADHPIVWIELGVNANSVNGGQQAFAPPFVANSSDSPAFIPETPAEAQRVPAFSFGEDGKIQFQPEGSSWIFSASVHYGRANNNRHVHQEAASPPNYEHLVYRGPYATFTVIPPHTAVHEAKNILDEIEKQSAVHAIIDFQTGKDVGLGLFGREGTSVFNAGVRIAQFTSHKQSTLNVKDTHFYSRHFPTPGRPTLFGTYPSFRFPQYLSTAHTDRSFHGIGPSLSWNASAPLTGNSGDGELSINWGANAAVLFGRQKADVQHQTTGQVLTYKYYNLALYHHSAHLHRSREVTVPNVGGFAEVSYQIEDFKVALGYRGDFFFGAMDTGFDTAKRSTIGFYGPFASVGVGLGG